MPIYEYRCDQCQEVSSLMQKLSDKAPATCSLCGGGPMTKQMSRTSFILKGGGWYVTDFRDGNKKPGKEPDGGADGEAAKTDGSGAADGQTKDAGTATAGSAEALNQGKSETNTASDGKTPTKSDAPAKTDKSAPASKTSNP